MYLASLARFCVVLFAGLGLLIQARILYSLTSPDEWDKVAFLWEIATATGRLSLIAAFLVPVCFYVFCIATCFVQLPRRVLIACVVVLAAAAVPVLTSIDDHYPTIARNALWTAFWWIPVFVEQLYAKPKPASDNQIAEEPVGSASA